MSDSAVSDSAPQCQHFLVHPDVVDRVRETTPNPEQLQDLADIFKILGDPTRVKIIYALLTSELCVCDIAVLIGTSQSAVSHQLKVLRQARLVRYRREGKTVFYSLKDDHVRQLVEVAQEHIQERPAQN